MKRMFVCFKRYCVCFTRPVVLSTGKATGNFKILAWDVSLFVSNVGLRVPRHNYREYDVRDVFNVRQDVLPFPSRYQQYFDGLSMKMWNEKLLV